jgi:hypothetical protein
MFVSAPSKVCQAAVDECDLAEYCPAARVKAPKMATSTQARLAQEKVTLAGSTAAGAKA